MHVLGHLALFNVSERRGRTGARDCNSHDRAHVDDCQISPIPQKDASLPGPGGQCVLYDGAGPADWSGLRGSLDLAFTNLPEGSVGKYGMRLHAFPELPGPGYPVAEAVPIGTAVSRPPLSTSSRRTHQPQCGGRTGQELIRRYGPEISERVDKLIPDAVCSHRLHVDLGGRMGSWKGRMLDLFGAAGIRKSQRLPQLGVVVTRQREKAPVRARRDPAFRAFERSPHPSASVGVSRVRSD